MNPSLLITCLGKYLTFLKVDAVSVSQLLNYPFWKYLTSF